MNMVFNRTAGSDTRPDKAHSVISSVLDPVPWTRLS